ncbi:MAG TPA: hypothetical protein P5169_00380 [Kiritimatiellia bacterium]|nr:hypothetical protein [Kiritimatiellia bacterium]
MSPVVAGLDPPAVVLDRGAQSLFHEGFGQNLAGIGGEIVIQPIVADGQREGHFGHIEEVRGIPVGEGGGGHKFGGTAVSVRGIAAEAVCHGESGDAVKDTSRNTKQAASFQLALVGAAGEHQVGVVQDAIERGAHERIGGGVSFQRGEISGIREQARMSRWHAAQRGGNGVERWCGRALRAHRADGADEEEKGQRANREASNENP